MGYAEMSTDFFLAMCEYSGWRVCSGDASLLDELYCMGGEL